MQKIEGDKRPHHKRLPLRENGDGALSSPFVLLLTLQSCERSGWKSTHKGDFQPYNASEKNENDKKWF